MHQRNIACFVALALAATACGSDHESSADLRPTRPTTAAETPAEPQVAAENSDADEAITQYEAATETTGARDDTPDDNDQSTAAESNPIVDPADDALSTFAMDVDTGSYTYARGSLQQGVIPDPATVRTEEFVNALPQDYSQPDDDEAFAVTVDATGTPFLPADARVVRVGIQGQSIDDDDRADANLTFVIDISGSMSDPGKLDAVRPALRRLVDSLRSRDKVAIVVYSDDTRLLLESTSVRDRERILDAIDELEPEGSTNVEDGLRLGYTVARQTLDRDRINRVVLLSDGVANVGATGPEEILEIIEDSARDGVDLVTVGFGLGEYNDSLMEQLADQGDGFYAYVDGEDEAVRLFTEDLTGTLVTIAREAKVQVEFNPATVASYRLIGFENRAVADEDFLDDSVDGGEVGAGHDVTALYEVTLREAGSENGDTSWLARAAIHWLDPDSGAPQDLATTLFAEDVSDSIADAPLRLQQDIYVAAFAETLRDGRWSGLISLDGLSQNLHSLSDRLEDDDLAEFADIVDARLDLD